MTKVGYYVIWIETNKMLNWSDVKGESNMKNKKYQVVADGLDNGGMDEKQDCNTLTEARKWCKFYLKDGYEGTAIYNKVTNKWIEFQGEFRKELVLQ